MKDGKLTSMLEDCRIKAFNAKEDETIKTALAPYGYTDERLQEGIDIFNETNDLFKVQKLEYAEQRKVTDDFLESFKISKKTFIEYGRIARIAFKNKVEGLQLIPNPLRIDKYSEWKVKASTFYKGILNSESLLADMARMGRTAEMIEQEMSNATELELLSQKRYIEEGEAQSATENRNNKLDDLMEYRSELVIIAKIALKNQPQQLEKLGILVR